MINPLVVTPEHLCMTSAGLTAAQAAASTAIAASSATIVTAPAGADDVSIRMTAAFGAYAASFLQAASAGLGKHQAGAQALVPVAAGFQATDAGGGAAIGAHSGDFAIAQVPAQIPVSAAAGYRPADARDGAADSTAGPDLA